MLHVNGTCHCGAISIEAEIDESKVIVCHCLDCQVLSGAPFRVVAPVTRETLNVSGTPERYIKIAASGNRRAQMFCGTCGTPLYATDPDNPDGIISLRTGFLDQRAALTPFVQIWHKRAQPWLDGLCKVQAFEEMPPKLT